MIVTQGQDARIKLQEPENFRAFSFSTSPGKPLVDSDDVIFQDEHAWISIAALQSYPVVSADPEWRAGLAAMIDYAAGKGWVDGTGERLRAHIERGA